MTRIVWVVTKVDLIPSGQGFSVIQAHVSLAIEGQAPWTTIPVQVRSTMTGAEMLAALRTQIAPVVAEWTSVGQVRASLLNATGIEEFP
jgi:hypothetical protein